MPVTPKVAFLTAMLAGLFGRATSARAEEARAAEEPTPFLVPKSATGFLLLNGTLQSVPSAIARSQTDYGIGGTVGVSASGRPWAKWDYLAYVTAAVGADAVNGTYGVIAPEQITVRFTPVKALTFQAGFLRIPFSIAQSTVITNSMFPTRPEPTNLFQSGADQRQRQKNIARNKPIKKFVAYCSFVSP